MELVSPKAVLKNNTGKPVLLSLINSEFKILNFSPKDYIPTRVSRCKKCSLNHKLTNGKT